MKTLLALLVGLLLAFALSIVVASNFGGENVVLRTADVDGKQHATNVLDQPPLMDMRVKLFELRSPVQQVDRIGQAERQTLGLQMTLERLHEFEIGPGIDAQTVRAAVDRRIEHDIETIETLGLPIEHRKLVFAQFRPVGKRIGLLPGTTPRYLHAFEQTAPVLRIGWQADEIRPRVIAKFANHLIDRWAVNQRAVRADQ